MDIAKKGKSYFRMLSVEVKSLEEAMQAVNLGFNYIQFDRVEPQVLKDYVTVLKRTGKDLTIGVGVGSH